MPYKTKQNKEENITKKSRDYKNQPQKDYVLKTYIIQHLIGRNYFSHQPYASLFKKRAFFLVSLAC